MALKLNLYFLFSGIEEMGLEYYKVWIDHFFKYKLETSFWEYFYMMIQVQLAN